VFLEIGGSHIKSDKKMDKQNIIRNIFDDLEKRGETLGNSLARQGLLILSWLDKKK